MSRSTKTSSSNMNDDHEIKAYIQNSKRYYDSELNTTVEQVLTTREQFTNEIQGNVDELSLTVSEFNKNVSELNDQLKTLKGTKHKVEFSEETLNAIDTELSQLNDTSSLKLKIQNFEKTLQKEVLDYYYSRMLQILNNTFYSSKTL